MDTCRLSFVVAAYNAQRTLARTLGSLAGAPAGCEVLVIDDGSTDATGRIADAFCALQPGFRAIHQDNAGLGRVRNTGLAQARGRYVTFCDADDIFLPDNHLALVERMDAEAADVGVGLGFSLIGGRTMTEFWDNALVRTLHHLGPTPERRFLKHLVQPSACTKVFRRAYARDAGLRFTEGRLFEDVEFTTFAMLHTQRLVFEALPLFIYEVKGEGQITADASARRLEILDNLAPIVGRLLAVPTDGIETLALTTVLLRTALWCLDHLPAQHVADFKSRLLATFAPLALRVAEAELALMAECVTDPWDRRAFAVAQALVAGGPAAAAPVLDAIRR